MNFKITLAFIAFLWAAAASAQATDDNRLVGTWKGTSICQVKDSPCQDEQVVYYISKGDNPREFKVRATKIVEGAEADMGTLVGTFTSEAGVLVCTSKPDTIWTFKLKGQKMNGTLLFNRALYRIVEVTKV